MFFVALLFSLAVAQVCNTPNGEDRRPDKSRLRLASFNVAWLFDGVNDPSGSPWANPTEASLHVQKIAEQIMRIDADIIAVHEAESSFFSSVVDVMMTCFLLWRVVFSPSRTDCNILSSLVGFLGPSYKWWLVPGTDTATNQNSALVTRIDPSGPLFRTEARASIPVAGTGCATSSASTTGVSKHARARIVASSFSFDLVFAHLKLKISPPLLLFLACFLTFCTGLRSFASTKKQRKERGCWSPSLSLSLICRFLVSFFLSSFVACLPKQRAVKNHVSSTLSSFFFLLHHSFGFLKR